ncbi:hypothetical protein EWB00_005456 [Schistosoma japonicum]|uniref:Uncharacterized protein n=1 Tax=Schistosoma japonicum TaxID=6182 RepID=A0A4Z2DUF7_SCHJA|nr:hypothetical protein KSF78_0003652 [Schistosoma japonicum]KAH8867264.1 hypothetical protein KSF78_0003652 [Schistosoma japonicum]TNN20096.1 hypothetical protein EWB00_005456 [Schistosoma japonicum]TNN20097.1 hypothetical protein EWB00_005456 [Schistosoma japonicum]TNN20098.1 hypothetical protein EWB00_005456 [Schistosoma japonicum]
MASPGFWSFLFSLLNTVSIQNDRTIVRPDPSTVTPSLTTTTIDFNASSIPDFHNTSEILLLTECVAIQSIVLVVVNDPKNNLNLNIYLDNTLQDNVTVNGTCEEEKQSLKVIWISSSNQLDISLTFDFVEDSQRYDLERIKFTYMTKSGTEIEANSDRGLFTIPVGGYYVCANQMYRELFVDDNEDVKIVIYFLNSTMEAFRPEHRTQFMGLAIDCPSSILWYQKVPTVVCFTLLLIIVAILLMRIFMNFDKQSAYQPIK